MKKRFLCIIMAVLLVVPMIFTACDDTRSDEEIIQSILEGASTALTLSVWIPTESDTSDPVFVERLNNVEAAINSILIEKNYSTKVDLIAVNDVEYEAAVKARYESMSDGHNSGDAYRAAQEYVNTVEKFWPDKVNDPDTYIYQIKYPDVLDYQMDIFLIRGYEDYIGHIEDGNLKDIDSFISVHGSAFSNVNKLIRPNILSQMKINGKTYALPNNHLYIDKYQYVVIDKDLFDSTELDINDIKTLYDAESFINAIGGTENVVPFLGSMQDAMGIYFVDPDLYLGAVVGGGAASNLFENQEYQKFVSFYKGLCESNYVSESLEVEQTAAVQLFNGTKAEAESMFSSDDYYLVGTPVASTSTVYESLFAISSYSADPERAMKVLYLLETDEEIRTLIQYGIENIDYSISYDEVTEEKVIHVKNDTPYKMNVYHTGNPYYTYPSDNSSISDWADVKEQNASVVVDPLIAYDYILASDKITEEAKAALEASRSEVVSLYQAYIDGIVNMTKAEFDDFALINIPEIYEIVKAKELEILSEMEYIAEYNEELANTEDQDEIDELNEKIAESERIIDELEQEIADAKAPIAQYSFVDDLYSSDAYYNVLKFYTDLQAIRGN